MDEQTQLKDSILAQAHEKGRKLLEETKETILKEETAQEERLIQEKLNQRPSSSSGFNVNCNVKPNKSKIKTPINPCHQTTSLKGSLCRCLRSDGGLAP